MKKSLPLLGGVHLAIITIAMAACGGEPATFTPESTSTPTTAPPTFTPVPTPQMVLGMDTDHAVEMLNAKGWRFKWDDELGSYAHLVNVNPNFWLDETNGVITRVTVFVIDRPSLDWQAPTDQFFEDCNLPRPMLGGVAAFMDTYQGKLSIDSTVTIHPVPGIEFTVHEWGIGLRLLSYTLID